MAVFIKNISYGYAIHMAYYMRFKKLLYDPEGLEVLRHSTAHLLAHAVKELFPEAQVTIGPVIENGFFHDFAYKRPLTPEDLVTLGKPMT